MFNFQITGKKIQQTTNKPNKILVQSKIKQTPKKIQKIPIVPKKIMNNNTGKIQTNKNNVNKQQKKIQIKINEQKQKTQQKTAQLSVNVPAQTNQQNQIKDKQIQANLKQQIKPQIIQQVIIRYNHYKATFQIKDKILTFVPIEQKYSFAEVFKGNYQPVIKYFKQGTKVQPLTIGKAIEYTWQLEGNKQYRLQIQQDQQQQSKHQKKAYIAPKKQEKCPHKKNSRFDEITAELKKLQPHQFGSAKHKALLQERDLQDILYS